MYRHRIAAAFLFTACLGTFAFGSPIHTNLLANPSAAVGLTDWTFVNAGNGWAISSESQDGDNASFVTSWDDESMSQTIDLLAAGFSPAELDDTRAINIQGWAKSTQWHTDHARAIYQLQDASNNVLASYDSNWINDVPFTWTPLSWQTSLPVGTRKVAVTYIGYDGEFWVGHYGVAFDAASVVVAPEPASLGTLAIAAVGLITRRRRK